MNKMKAWLSILSVISFLIFASSAHATTTTPFFDDFEDGEYTGWLSSTSGGSGTTDVVDKDGSKMAHVYHNGNYRHSLSQDFYYTADSILSFDMLAVAVYGGNGYHAGSGVTISLLDNFNISLGTATFTNKTSALGTNEYAVDQTQHNYENTLGDYAALTGLDPTDSSISKISLSFFAWGAHNYRYNGRADVWFDNVSISVVPVPGTLWLFFSGMFGIIGILRPKRQT